MKNYKKSLLIFGSACILSLSTTMAFANSSTEPTNNVCYNTKVEMGRSIDSQDITAVPATKIADSTNTKVDMDRGTDSQNITAASATKIANTKTNTKVDMERGTDSQQLTAVSATNIACNGSVY